MDTGIIISYIICISFCIYIIYAIYTKKPKQSKVSTSLFSYVQKQRIEKYDPSFNERLTNDIQILNKLIDDKSDNFTLILQFQRNLQNKLSDLMILDKEMFKQTVEQISTRLNDKIRNYVDTNRLMFEDPLASEWSI